MGQYEPIPEYSVSEIPGWQELCYQTGTPEIANTEDEREQWEDQGDGTFRRLNPTTLALIHAAAIIGLPSLTTHNVDEWIYRITSLYDSGLAFLSSETPEGDIPVALTPMNIVGHIGLEVSIETHLILGPIEFDQLIRRRRMAPIHAALRKLIPIEGYDDDEDAGA